MTGVSIEIQILLSNDKSPFQANWGLVFLYLAHTITPVLKNTHNGQLNFHPPSFHHGSHSKRVMQKPLCWFPC